MFDINDKIINIFHKDLLVEKITQVDHLGYITESGRCYPIKCESYIIKATDEIIDNIKFHNKEIQKTQDSRFTYLKSLTL